MNRGAVGAFPIAAELVRSWLARMNVPLRNVWIVTLIFGVVVACFSAVLAFVVAGAEEIIPREPAFLGLALVLVHFLSALTSVTIAASSAQDSAVMAWWRSSPVSDRVLGLGWSIPSWCLTLAQLAIAIPVLVAVFGDAVDPALITYTTVCAILVGTVAGRAAFVAARAVLRRMNVNLGAHAQALATLAWVLCLAGATEVIRLTLTSSGDSQVSLSAVLGYPSLVLAVVRSSFLDLGLLAVWLVAAVMVEAALWPHVAAVRHDAGKVLRVGPAFSGRGRFPLLKLELTRLARRRRVQAAVLSTLVIQAALVAVHQNLDSASRQSFVDSAILVNSVLVAYAPLLVRGMSSRSTPYAMIMGRSPGSWAFAVTVSGLLMTLATASPALVLWSVSSGDAGIFVAGFGLASFAGAAAAVTGFLLTPGDDTGVGESMGMFIVGASLFLVAKALTPIGFDTLLTAGPVMGVLSLGLLFVPSVIESLRWGQQVNTSESISLGKEPACHP